jgi:predicted permease
MIAPIVLALLPIVLLIAFGYLMRRRAFLPDAFWPQAERLSYFVLLPCLFVHGLATADLSNVPVGPLAGTLLLSTLVVATLLVSLWRSPPSRQPRSCRP